MDLPAYVKAASHPARVVGLNTVGLSRNGISEESISHLKKAYKLLYRKSLKLEEALLKIEELNNKYNDKHLLNFINSVKISSRGITR
jgi:UDP-N-acetylglucosamine acyltransferase